MIPKDKMINLVFDDNGKVKVKCEVDAIPTPIVEEVVNSAINAYECSMLSKIDKDERIKYLKRWNWALSMALATMVILSLVR